MTVFLWTTIPAPSREPPPPYCRMPGGPHGRRPGASHSQPRSVAASRARAMALKARSTCSMGCRRAPGAKAWAGASAAAAGWARRGATRGTPTPRRARAVQGSRPGSRRAARCSFLRTGAQERRRRPPGLVGPALPPKPSWPRAPRRLAGSRPPPPPPRGWAPALPRPWGLTTPETPQA